MPRMHALPPDLLPGDPTPIDWVRAQGIVAETVCGYGFHLAELDDGTFVLHYLEFLAGTDGRRILVPAESDDWQYGGRSGYAKRPRLMRVTSRPECTVLVVDETTPTAH